MAVENCQEIIFKSQNTQHKAYSDNTMQCNLFNSVIMTPVALYVT